MPVTLLKHTELIANIPNIFNTRMHKRYPFQTKMVQKPNPLVHIQSTQPIKIIPDTYGVPSGPKFNFWILLVLLAFDIVVLQFVLTSAIQHSSSNFSTPIDDLTLFHNSTSKFMQFNIQVYNSTSKFTQFNIQVYTIQHSTLEKLMRVFDIQLQSSQWQSVWAQKTIKILPV